MVGDIRLLYQVSESCDPHTHTPKWEQAAESL